MSSNWEKCDDDAKGENRIDFGLVISFKKMIEYLELLDEGTRTVDEKYPKNLLLKIWGSCMVILLVLLSLFFLVVTLFFSCFYFYVIIKLGKVWKRFGYSTAQYWIMTIAGFILQIGVAVLLQEFVFHLF